MTPPKSNLELYQEMLKKQSEELNAPIDNTQLDAAQQQLNTRQLTSNLGEAFEQVGRGVAGSTQPVGADFYKGLKDQATQDYNIASLQSKQKREDKDKIFQKVKDLASEERSNEYLKIQKEQEDRAKERMQTEKLDADLKLKKAQLEYQDIQDKKTSDSQISQVAQSALTVSYPEYRDIFKGKSYNELQLISDQLGAKAKRDLDKAEIENKKASTAASLELKKLYAATKQDQYEEKKLIKQNEASKISDKQITEVTDFDNILGLISDIQKEKPKFDTGPVSALQNKAASFVGMDDADKSTFRAKVTEQLSDYIKSKSGLTVSDKERSTLLESVPKMSDNDEVFSKKLQFIKNKMAMNKSNMLNNLEKKGKNVDPFKNSNEVERITSDGRTAIFDANTKQFLRYK